MKVSENLSISASNNSLKSCTIVGIVLIKNSSKRALGVKSRTDPNSH